MADATVTYGSYTFPTPSPFVAETTAPILLSGQSDYFMDQVSLIGNITGSDLSGLDFDYSTYLNNDPITFESDYITGVDGTDYIPGKRPGGDMDSLDNVIEFKTKDDESRKD